MKKILTAEITDWLTKEIKESQDETIQKVFGNREWKTSDYFHTDDSLRLRSTGYQLLKTFFEHEEFVHDREFYSGEILALSQHMNAPFYINRDKIVLFHNEHIVMCKLAGSVALWLQNFS